MSPKLRRVRVLLNMVLAFVVIILLTQLWLFTVALEAMQTPSASTQVLLAALLCSFIGCAAVCALIRLFLREGV